MNRSSFFHPLYLKILICAGRINKHERLPSEIMRIRKKALQRIRGAYLWEVKDSEETPHEKIRIGSKKMKFK